ncbi:MAG: hypothetical protein Q9M94_02335 [Candidatus Gracilibacteria bacterium]|nr:hypothetical protein [Candidatus Gracilibacteria bacterium]MDQ7022430.1 hypothetical protein [Candidatus Gracilibacteria bacterium]
MIKNIIKIISSFIGMIGMIIGIAIIAIPAYYFIEKDLIIGNLGHTFFITEITLTVIISLLFGLFIGATLYKINYFSVKKSGIGILGGFIGALVSGCPACSITLASYLGLAGFMYLLPYSGLELKVLSVLILLYANYSTIKNLEVCKIKK